MATQLGSVPGISGEGSSVDPPVKENLDKKGLGRAPEIGNIACETIGTTAMSRTHSGRSDVALAAVMITDLIVGAPVMLTTTLTGAMYGGTKGAILGACLPGILFVGIPIAVACYPLRRYGEDGKSTAS
ncbi:MAG: hypothetical protein OXF02_02345 [Simkaniaceae bacterium]|nr:hypothetical protein [Simkaniaceae bacterium]